MSVPGKTRKIDPKGREFFQFFRFFQVLDENKGLVADRPAREFEVLFIYLLFIETTQ